MENVNSRYVWKNQKRLRTGYTTGSCAAGAAKAAVQMLLGDEAVRQVRLHTPKGIELYLEVEKPARGLDWVSCAVRKDSGDDPDVTDGVCVYAKAEKTKEPGVRLQGGEGGDQSGSKKDDPGSSRERMFFLWISGWYRRYDLDSGGSRACRTDFQPAAWDRGRDLGSWDDRNRRTYERAGIDRYDLCTDECIKECRP